jgi:hypothetical protein
MSLSSITRASVDPDLRARVDAAAHQEAQSNPAFGDTEYGRALLGGYQNTNVLMWAVAVDTEAAYETALVSGRGAPGHDTDIITDENITAAVQAHWPYAEGEAPP